MKNIPDGWWWLMCFLYNPIPGSYFFHPNSTHPPPKNRGMGYTKRLHGDFDEALSGLRFGDRIGLTLPHHIELWWVCFHVRSLRISLGLCSFSRFFSCRVFFWRPCHTRLVQHIWGCWAPNLHRWTMTYTMTEYPPPNSFLKPTPWKHKPTTMASQQYMATGEQWELDSSQCSLCSVHLGKSCLDFLSVDWASDWD